MSFASNPPLSVPFPAAYSPFPAAYRHESIYLASNTAPLIVVDMAFWFRLPCRKELCSDMFRDCLHFDIPLEIRCFKTQQKESDSKFGQNKRTHLARQLLWVSSS